MKAYQLKAFLRNLSLCGIEDGELQWVGTVQEWKRMEDEINHYREINY